MGAKAADQAFVREEVDKLLASKRFLKTKTLGHLLRFLADRTLAGAPPPTEETIAAEVFGRRADFVPQLDPVVRVQYRRLHAALQEYYEAEGRASQSLLATSESGFGIVVADRSALKSAERRWKPLRLAAAGAVAAVLLCTGVGIRIERHQKREQQAVDLENKARALLEVPSIANAATGARLFEQALEADPNYEPAWSGLAGALIMPGAARDMSRSESLQKAREAAVKAVNLDPNDGMAHASLAYVKLFADNDWRGAEAEYRLGIQATPGYARIHAMFAQGLMAYGRFDEAIAQAKLAARLQPAGSPATPDLSEILTAARRYDEAIAEARRVLAATDSSSSAHLALGIALAAAGRYDQAIPEYQAAIMQGRSMYALARLGYAYGANGDAVAAQAVMSKLTQAFASMATVDWSYRALVYAGLDDRQHALSCLENAFSHHEGDMLFIGVDSAYDKLHNEPRFIALKKRIGLP